MKVERAERRQHADYMRSQMHRHGMVTIRTRFGHMKPGHRRRKHAHD